MQLLTFSLLAFFLCGLVLSASFSPHPSSFTVIILFSLIVISHLTSLLHPLLHKIYILLTKSILQTLLACIAVCNYVFSKFYCKLLFKLYVIPVLVHNGGSRNARVRKLNLLHSTTVPSNDPVFTPALYDKKEEM